MMSFHTEKCHQLVFVGGQHDHRRWQRGRRSRCHRHTVSWYSVCPAPMQQRLPVRDL